MNPNHKPPPVIEVRQFHSLQPGPKLLVMGGVHGNETAGPTAIREILAEFDVGARRLQRGVLTFIPVANPVAWAGKRREGDRNLNRDFRPAISPENAEDRITNRLAPILAQHDILIDLHTFSAQGEPFVFFGPQNNRNELEPFVRAAEEERLARAIGPRRLVYGWLNAYAKGVQRRQNGSVAYGCGTTEYMRAHGGIAVTVECGQHLDPEAPVVARAAIDNVLRMLDIGGLPAEPDRIAAGAHTGVDAAGTGPDGAARGQPSAAPLASVTADAAPAPAAVAHELIELHDVFDRHSTEDLFVREWRSFDPVKAGETIARRADGQVLNAPEDGYVVFPNPGTPPGREWFYFARPGGRQLAGGQGYAEQVLAALAPPDR